METSPPSAADQAALSALQHPPEGVPELPPRNRAERRRLERLLERREKKAKAHSPEPAPLAGASPAESAPPGKSAPPPRTDLPTFFLRQWCAVRGPLLADPRAAVCRALALSQVTALCRTSRDPGVRVRAARTLGNHSRAAAPSKAPATGKQFAAAAKLLAELNDLARALPRHLGVDAAGKIADRLTEAGEGPGSPLEQIARYAWAELLAAVLLAADDALRLRAAKTLLQWTAPEARQVGRGAPLVLSAEEKELLAEIRGVLKERFGKKEETAPPQPAKAPAAPTQAPG